MIANYSYVSGKQYTDFASSQDRVANVGLAALIAGGLGATAAKTRIIGKIILILLAFLKKLLIFLIVGLGFLKSWFSGKKLEASAEDNCSETTGS